MEFIERQNTIWLHATFWIVHLFIRVFISQFHPTTLDHTFWIELAEMPIKMGFTYVAIFFLVPKFLEKEKYLLLCIWSLLIIGALTLLKRLHDFYLVFPLFENFEIEFWDLNHMLKRLIYVFPTPGFALALYFAKKSS